jgi:hypothetical protein
LAATDQEFRKQFLLGAYNQYFNNVNRHILAGWQSFTSLIAVYALFSLVDKNSVLTDIATCAVILVLTWLIGHIFDASSWYNTNIYLIRNIEREFLEKRDIATLHWYFAKPDEYKPIRQAIDAHWQAIHAAHPSGVDPNAPEPANLPKLHWIYRMIKGLSKALTRTLGAVGFGTPKGSADMIRSLKIHLFLAVGTLIAVVGYHFYARVSPGFGSPFSAFELNRAFPYITLLVCYVFLVWVWNSVLEKLQILKRYSPGRETLL